MIVLIISTHQECLTRLFFLQLCLGSLLDDGHPVVRVNRPWETEEPVVVPNHPPPPPMSDEVTGEDHHHYQLDHFKMEKKGS